MKIQELSIRGSSFTGFIHALDLDEVSALKLGAAPEESLEIEGEIFTLDSGEIDLVTMYVYNGKYSLELEDPQALQQIKDIFERAVFLD